MVLSLSIYQLQMIKNYFIIALRTLKKNYQYTVINVIGMAVGLSGIILTLLIFNYENDFDAGFVNTNLLYRVNCIRTEEGEEQKWGVVPLALGPYAKNEIDGVQEYCRYGFSPGSLVQYGEIVHRESVAFSDKDFFEFFSFDVRSGNLKTFLEKQTVIISDDFAKKYFADSDPVGQIIKIGQDQEQLIAYVVGAVLSEIPKNSSFQFDLIIPIENIIDQYGGNEYDWRLSFRSVLYVQLAPGKEFHQVEEICQKYVPFNNEADDTWKINKFYFDPYNQQKDDARFIRVYTTWSGLPISALYGSLVMNTLILLIACFNFTNTSLVYANNRLREIGIRRTFGGLRKQIFQQFFFENFLMCIAALILSVEIANLWVMMLNRQWPIKIDTYNFDNWPITIYLVLLLFAVALIAGAFPAYYASRFHPTEILKGKIKFIGTNNFSRALLVWQFGFSIMAIFSGIVLTQNARFQKTMDWGFDKENIIVIPLQNEARYEPLRDILAKSHGDQNISGSMNILGYHVINGEFELDGIIHNADLLKIGSNYLDVVGCEMVEGRNFHKNSEFDTHSSVIVNETFVRAFQVDDPLNQKIMYEDTSFQIIGVVRDFMPYGFFVPIKPTLLNLTPETSYKYLVIRGSNSEMAATFADTGKAWKELYPDLPFDGFFMDELAAGAMHTNQGILMQFGILAIFALFMSVTGLYSVVSLNVRKRTKEIGIRKVHGASVASIMGLINLEFGIILLLAIIIGCVGGYYFMDRFLSDIFTYYHKIGASSFVIAGFIILALSALTSGIKIYVMALRSPTESLRYE